MYRIVVFDSWTTDNGLPQNSISSIIQTRDGYLWMTTFDGLVRFNGVQFKVFDKSNTKGLSKEPAAASTRKTWIDEYGRADGAPELSKK